MEWENISLNEIKTGSDGNGNRLISLFAREYVKLMNTDPCFNCPGLQDRYIKFLNKRKAMENVKNSGFKLKPMYEGVSLGFGSNQTLSAANLSDENALKFAKEHPKGVGLFEKVPEGFDVENFKPSNKDGEELPERVKELLELKKEDLEEEAAILEVSKSGNKTEIAKRIYEAEIAINSNEDNKNPDEGKDVDSKDDQNPDETKEPENSDNELGTK